MEIRYSERADNIRLIQLTGRLDIIGTGQVETQFAGYCAGQNVRVIVDLAGVDFLASIGIRMLLLTAKSVASRGGKMVLSSPTADVGNVLDITGIPGVIPMYKTVEEAEAALLA